MKKCVLLASCALVFACGAANWYYGTGFELPFTVAETNLISQYDTAGLELATNTTPRQYWSLPEGEDRVLIKRGSKYLDEYAEPFAYVQDWYSLTCNMPPKNPFVRYLTPDHGKRRIPDGESLYFDASIRFTSSDEMLDPEQVLKGDKIALWLYEQEKEDGTTEYQFMITGGYITRGRDENATVSKPHNYRVNTMPDWGFSVDTNRCYRVTIKCIDTLVKEEKIPGFVVSINDIFLITGQVADKGLNGYTLADQAYFIYEYIVPSAVLDTNSTIEAVRFEGDGLVDNILFSNTTDKNELMGRSNNLVVFRLGTGVESMTYTFKGVSHTVSNDYYISSLDGSTGVDDFCINGIVGSEGYTDIPILTGEENFSKETRDGQVWYMSQDFNREIHIQAVPGVMKMTDGRGNTTVFTNTDDVVDMFASHGGNTNYYVRVIRDFSDLPFVVYNGVNVTLDLNGHTISNKWGSPAIVVQDEGSLVITNSAAGLGKVSCREGDGGIYCDMMDSRLTIASGDYEATIYIDTRDGEYGYEGFKITSASCRFLKGTVNEDTMVSLVEALKNGLGTGYEFRDGAGSDEGWLVIRNKSTP